ncbi:RHS repeat-associated core domain-containing protein [Dactylosporangium sp. AC04546]|uniref:RHS repeat-associated core domain-containing protein n=1 Tax=Dactylosporangium sp. AC04546 TaxID=2862460 RepID=UPI001EDE6F2E|nr:RHS repeat-associated core domain-containing protein [Dactylosporangium sp. AC04546]WVK80444.1 RHS repeat-associated core domain-containing protein [Dactylosporangium sp. AC04546]
MHVVTMAGAAQAEPSQDKASCPADRPDKSAAMITARWCGGKVEVLSERSETTKVWANPDGSLTAEQFSGPVRVADGDTWKDVDTSLVADAGGSVSARVHPNKLKLSGAASGTEVPLVTLGQGEDELTLLWNGRLPQPKLDGATATYADVQEGVDLVIQSTRTGYEQFFVVKTREALARSGSLSLRLRAPKLQVAADGSGGLVLTDSRTGRSARIPEPSMWDSTVSAKSLDHLRVGKVTLTASQRGANIDLQLVPDPSFLALPDLAFPVVIDPTVNPTFDTFVQSGYTTDQSGSTDLKLGYSDDGGSWVARSFLRWDTTPYWGAQISSARVYLWNYHSWSCTPAKWQVWVTDTATTATRWTSQPYWDPNLGVLESTETKGYSASCNDGWVSAPAQNVFQAGANYNWAHTTMGLRAAAADESNHNTWKRFHSSEGANPPYAVVTYNTVPTIAARTTDPSTACVTGSARPFVNKVQPTLRAQVTDPEGTPVSATFEWWTTNGAVIGSATVGPQPSGSVLETTVPSGAFTNGGTYSWRVRGSDGSTTGSFTAFCEFTVDTTPPAAMPGVSSTTFPEGQWTGQPTGYSYTLAPSTPYISGTTVLPITGDDVVQQISLPFPISFYGQTYNSAWVDTNGMLSFSDPNGSHPDDYVGLPNSALPNNTVYVFAQDLVVDANASIRTAVIGSAPNRKFVLEWNNPYQYGFASRRLNAEVIFTETTGAVTFNYSGIDNAFEQGSAALIGLENGDGTVATQYSYLTPSANNLDAIQFSYVAGSAPVSAGTQATFALSSGGVADVMSYLYGLDASPTQSVDASAPGGGANIVLTPDSDGAHTLFVRSVDRAGNQSSTKAYQIYVGHGGLTSPQDGDMTGRRFVLSAIGHSQSTGMTYQWRRADTDVWENIPVAHTTLADGGAPISAWPLSPQSPGQYAKVNWDVAATLAAADAEGIARTGPLQIRPVFSGLSGGAATGIRVTFDPDQSFADTETVGPGEVNLVTGSFAVTATDASFDTLSISRTANTRQYGRLDPMFGPGWVGGAAASGDATYSRLTVLGSLVQVQLPDGSILGFTMTASNANGATFEPEVGAEDRSLSYVTAGDMYVITEAGGDTVTFTRQAGDPAGLYVPTLTTELGSPTGASYTWERVVLNGQTVVRPIRMLAAVPAGVSCTTLVRGCRALTLTYASTTTATGTDDGTWGSYTGRVSEVTITAWDPDLPTPAMRTISVARYSYDSTGRLRASWDPRSDWSDGGGSHTQRTTYAYDGDGVLTTIAPPGQEPWQLSFTTLPDDNGKGRLKQVSRSALAAGTAVQTIVYRVPLSGTGAPYDLSGTQTARWGQSEPPTDATAVFPADQIPTGNQASGALPGSYERATVSYLDANARIVNTAAPGGYVTSAWLDKYDNITRELSAANRAAALAKSATDTAAEEAQLASSYSTENRYSADGQRLVESFGPERETQLANGTLVRGRAHRTNAFDEGAPAGTTFDLVTTSRLTVWYSLGGQHLDSQLDLRQHEYDWAVREPSKTTVDPNGLNLVTRMTYDSAGRTTMVTAPGGGASNTTPSTRLVVYYTATANGTYAECGNRPEWSGRACRTHVGGQAATGPEVPAMITTYDIYGNPRVVTERNSSVVLRTTTVVYDAAGREYESILSGPGTPVEKTRQIYDPATGALVRTATINGSGVTTAEVIRQYDTLGRLTSYTDADGNVSVMTYDIRDRIVTGTDGKATRTITYDGGTERRGLATSMNDSQVGMFTVAYDADGVLQTEQWPNGIVMSLTRDEAGARTSLTYSKPGCGVADCTMFREAVKVSGLGQVVDRQSTLSTQAFTYDAAGRLTTVRDTVAAECATRTYTFTNASNRTSLTQYGPGAQGACQSSTVATSQSWTYDAADRVTSSGYQYDQLGRATLVPAVDTASPAGGDLTVTYHANDLVDTLTHGGRTSDYQLDVNAKRIRSWTTTAPGETTSATNHYSDDADSPAWTQEAPDRYTRVIKGIGSLAGSYEGGANILRWTLTNLHGDAVAVLDHTDSALSATSETTEYGLHRIGTNTGSQRYGWLAAYQRAADTPSGVVLMGVRVYNPKTGRFLSVDPVAGGNANAYTYPTDPINWMDLDGRIAIAITIPIGFILALGAALLVVIIGLWLAHCLVTGCLVIVPGVARVPWPSPNAPSAKTHRNTWYIVYEIVFFRGGRPKTWKYGISRVGTGRPAGQIMTCRVQMRASCDWRIKRHVKGWYTARSWEATYILLYVASHRHCPPGQLLSCI